MKKTLIFILFLAFAASSMAQNAVQKADYSKSPGAVRLVAYNVGVFSKYRDDSTRDIAAMMLELDADAVAVLKQGAVHFALTAAVWIAVELACFWPVTPPVVISFSVSVGGTYAITWGVQYFVWRSRVRALNEQIHRKNGGEE